MDPFEGRYRYCPRCGTEYRPGFDVCADCGVDLVDDPPRKDEVEGGIDHEAVASWVGTDPVAVFTTGSEIDAALVRGALVDADIPASVWSSGYGAYLGHASTVGAFACRVMVHKDDEAEARELLASRFDDTLEE